MVVTPPFSFFITSPRISKIISDESTKNNHLHNGTPKDHRSVEKPEDYRFGHSQTTEPLSRTYSLHE